MGIEFTDRILDNVHGFIEYTNAEKAIMDTLLFKRLQSIKQLSIANWIFPGSEHTRFIHSLGVMHIADKIALRLNLGDDDRKIIRIAGLLHDIGHYPLSHVCEMPYRQDFKKYDEKYFCQLVNRDIKDKIDSFSVPITKEFMKASLEGHHEAVGEAVIKNSIELRDIIIGECGEQSIDIICDMITGNVKRSTTNPLWVQILHSEIDADGIDYMMRDAAFAGTGFGSFEMNQLIICFEKRTYQGKEILCINEKGIAAADQYLINKFFSYSQVIFNKHISNLEWMSETIIEWILNNSSYIPFPNKETLLKHWINKKNNFDNYLSFTDNFFWKSIGDLKTTPKKYYAPDYITNLCTKLLNHEELKYIDNSEVKIISKNANDIKKQLQNSILYKELLDKKNVITLMCCRPVIKNVPLNIFKKNLEKNIPDELREDEKQYIKDRILYRYMEGICVCNINDDKIHLLCDDERSLMKQLYGTNLVICRAFEFPVDDEEDLTDI